VIAQLIAAPQHSPHSLFREAVVHPEGLFIHGATIVGEYLNLDGITLRTKLFFYDCLFTRDRTGGGPDGGICMRDSHATTISLERCRLLTIDARRARIGGNFYLEDCDIVCGLNLHNFEVGGYAQIIGCSVFSQEYDPAAQDAALAFDRSRQHDMIPRVVELCAIDAEAATVKDSFVVSTTTASGRRTRAFGQVSLERAEIGGHLDCRGAEIAGPLTPPEIDDGQRIALHAAGVRVRGSVLLGQGFSAEGEVRFEHSKIAGDFWCAGGRFANPIGKMEAARQTPRTRLARFLGRGRAQPQPAALNLRSAEVMEGIYLEDGEIDLPTVVDGRLILSNARCLLYCDSKGADGDIASPPGHALEIDAFTYQRLGECTKDPAKRDAWLNGQIDAHIRLHFRPQPWKQLTSVLQDMGYNNAARIIAIKRQVALRRSRSLSGPGKIMNAFLGVTIGHGYRPNFAVLWALVFVLPGALVFSVAAEKGWMAPQRDTVLASVDYWERDDCRLPQSYRRLKPALYTLDLFVPIIDSMHTSDWGPSPVARACAEQPLRTPNWLQRQLSAAMDQAYAGGLRRLFEQGFLEFARWMLVVSGWILVPLFLAGVTGIVKRFEH